MNAKDPINIFVVDDNKVFALALKAEIETTFAEMPVTVHVFVTGETCMMQFNEVKPQVVILDYHLNSRYFDAENGIKVLEWIKKDDKETQVIMLSNEEHIDVAIQSFNNGAFDYVIKTETKFKRINNSLSNLFKMMKAKSEAKKYKYLVAGLLVCIAFLFGIVLVAKICSPSIAE